MTGQVNIRGYSVEWTATLQPGWRGRRESGVPMEPDEPDALEDILIVIPSSSCKSVAALTLEDAARLLGIDEAALKATVYESKNRGDDPMFIVYLDGLEEK
jgi:hypothetical protein